MAYAYGLSYGVVATVHVLVGLFLAWLGYQLLNKKPVGQPVAVTLIVLGALVSLYHVHLWWSRRNAV